MEAARLAVVENEFAIAHWRFALEDYRRANDLPTQGSYHSPVLADEYAHMGPTELVYHWAGKHNGEVVVKELAKVSMEAGTFKEHRLASSSIYAVVKRKNFTRLGPGYYKAPVRHLDFIDSIGASHGEVSTGDGGSDVKGFGKELPPVNGRLQAFGT